MKIVHLKVYLALTEGCTIDGKVTNSQTNNTILYFFVIMHQVMWYAKYPRNEVRNQNHIHQRAEFWECLISLCRYLFVLNFMSKVLMFCIRKAQMQRSII